MINFWTKPRKQQADLGDAVGERGNVTQLAAEAPLDPDGGDREVGNGGLFVVEWHAILK